MEPKHTLLVLSFFLGFVFSCLFLSVSTQATTMVKAKLRCKECESSDVEILTVKQGKNEGKSYAVCDNGCTSINKQTGKRSKKWIDWVTEEKEEKKRKRSPSPPPKKQQGKNKKQEDTEEDSGGEGELEMDANTIRLEELKNGQRQMQDELKQIHQRLVTLYSKLPLASQWPTQTQNTSSSKPSSTPSEQLSQRLNNGKDEMIMPSQKTSSSSSFNPLFNLDNLDSNQY